MEPIQALMGAGFLHEDPRDLRDAVPDILANKAGIRDKHMHPVARRLLAQGVTLTDIAATIGREIKGAQGERDISPFNAADFAITTDDMAKVLADSVERIISQSYGGARDHLSLVTRIATGDYKPVQLPELDVDDDLSRVFEGGEDDLEMTGVSITGGEKASLKTFGRALAISRRVLLSDHEGSLDLLARRLGDSAARNEANEVYKIISDNPTLEDGSALWSGDSFVNSGETGLTAEALRQGMAALRNQKTVGGHYGNFSPRTLLVSPAKEQTALELVRSISTSAPRLRVVASPWLSDGAVYLFASPDTAPVIGLLTLDGEDAPSASVTPRRDNIHRRQILQIWQDVGATAVSRRGAVKVTV